MSRNYRIPEEVQKLLGKKRETTRAFLYTRVSGKDQKEDLKTQLKTLEQYAVSKSYQIDEKVKEIATGYFIAVDYNADNVSLGNNNFLIQVRTELGRLTRFYSDVRTRIQGTHLTGWKRKLPSKKGENSSRDLDIGR